MRQRCSKGKIITPRALRLGVLASGRGSNLQSIINAGEDGRLTSRVAVVISDNPGAFALERARRHGIPAHVARRGEQASKQAFEREIVRLLREYRVDLVCLAGYMRIVTAVMLDAFRDRIINIHPSLLPSFPGLYAQRQALEYGVRFTGCTVHFIDEGVDTGPVILQAAVPVRPDDTEETLSARILEQEHRIYVEAVRLYERGKLRINGRRVLIG